MNINTVTPFNTNFNARIKLNQPKFGILTQSAVGAGAMSAGAACLYSVANANLINNALPETVKLNDDNLELAQLSNLSGAVSAIGTPLMSGSAYLSNKACPLISI